MGSGFGISSKSTPARSASVNLAGNIPLPKQPRLATQSQAASTESSDAATTTITRAQNAKASGFNFNEMLQRLKTLRGSSESSANQVEEKSASQPPTVESGKQSAAATQVMENQPPPPDESGTLSGSPVGEP